MEKTGWPKTFTRHCISRSFPKLSAENLKAGIFEGPQIRKLINDVNFTESMTTAEKIPGISFFGL